ncbi:hypothetical protein ABIQ69_11290 [Agromyces sp. G08B096]|uniref:XRE family transcriptional regulator n=1 Tax=Agromyces sp. G08B096 TaxID=3156399 RepID=A0AAU7W4U3_9MICO
MANGTTKVWMDQLSDDIQASEWGSVRSFASRGLEMNYHVFRRYLVGEREIPFWLLMDAIAKLGFSFSEYEQRVQARAEAEASEE